MMMVDTDNRWIYKGSVTTPPCDTFVYWNVLQRVYPIKQRHLDQFLLQLKRGKLDVIGNYRETQEIDLHNPFLITDAKYKKADLFIADKLYLSNKQDGSVVVQLNQTNGANASFNPKLDGTFQIDYSDNLGRTFSISSDGSDFVIPSFAPNPKNGSLLISSDKWISEDPALKL